MSGKDFDRFYAGFIQGMQTTHEFQGKKSIILKPGLAIDRWNSEYPRLGGYLGKSTGEEVERRWEDFKKASEKRGLKVQDKCMVCTNFWAGTTGDALVSFVYPETFKTFATSNLGFTYSTGQEAAKIPGIDLYAMGVCGRISVDGSYEFLARRPDGRLDTVGANFLEPEDLKSDDIFTDAFVKEGGKNSIEPELAEMKDVLLSKHWKNISAYLEGEASMEKINEVYKPKTLEFMLPKKDRLLFLEQKEPNEIKYHDLILCPNHKLAEYVYKNRYALGDRTTAILKRRFSEQGI